MSELAQNKDRLSAFLSGELTETENEQIIQQLLDDEKALRIVDRMWQDAFEAAAAPEDPAEEIINTGEGRLFRRLRRSQLTNHFVNFGATGFIDVMLAFLKPLFDRPRPGSKGNQEDNG